MMKVTMCQIVSAPSPCIVHFNTTYNPTHAWVSQQLRSATPFNTCPRYLIRDHDRKFGHQFSMVAKGANIDVLRTLIRALKANAHCERFIGSVRRECLDHILVVNERYLRGKIRDYVEYFNFAPPHQGIGQRIPESTTPESNPASKRIEAVPF